MKKLYSVLALWLLNGLVFAQTANANLSDVEPVSPFGVYAFVIIFFGMIIGVVWHMWKGDKDPASAGPKKQ